jgi:hypothetical protein
LIAQRLMEGKVHFPGFLTAAPAIGGQPFTVWLTQYLKCVDDSRFLDAA